MIHYNIHYKPYDWDIEMYVILNDDNIEKIIQALEGCSESEMQRAFLSLTRRVDSGIIKTFHKRSVIIINKPSTIEEFINIYNHEKNHLEMHICKEYDIDPHSEAASELSGQLAKCLYSSLVEQLLIYYTEIYNNK